MNAVPSTISLEAWSERYRALKAAGLEEPGYGGPLERHVAEGDTRLRHLRFDNSAAALGLWNLLLTEEQRLHEARSRGATLVGAMKDLGTIPVLCQAFPEVVSYYLDGAWWIPCIMEHGARAERIADRLGIDDSFCPVRAVLGAFESGDHFPIPDIVTCSVGATCDDLSAIAQRLATRGHKVFWWEVPHRRAETLSTEKVALPGGLTAPRTQADLVLAGLQRIAHEVAQRCGHEVSERALSEAIRRANRVRERLRALRHLVFSAKICPLPALEMLIAEMLAIHFCSDLPATLATLAALAEEARRRIEAGVGVLARDAVRVFWVNPVADLRVMNLVEECGGRICGTEYLFSHALHRIPEDLPPLEALARVALADPMVGPAADRASIICEEARRFGCETVIISRIPGASHCAYEGKAIGAIIREALAIPTIEVEVPPVSDAVLPTLRTRIEAAVEAAKERRPL